MTCDLHGFDSRHAKIGRLAMAGCVVLTMGMARAANPAGAQQLPGTAALEERADWSESMVAGISRWADRETERVAAARDGKRSEDPAADADWLAKRRLSLAEGIGLIDPRTPADEVEMKLDATASRSAEAGAGEGFRAFRVRWDVFPGVYGDGLLLEPHGEARAAAIVLPDADQTPEMAAGLEPGIPPSAQTARRLAESGCRVIVPALVSREIDRSGSVELGIFTNQPHREWIYRMTFELGRHLIGAEVGMTLSAADWLARQRDDLPLGIAGYGEGGLIALHSAALDARFDAALVSGYFGPRERLFAEPIERNVFGLLRDFGDAELAAMIAPRTLVIEHSPHPDVTNPPPVPEGRRSGAAPGEIRTPEGEAVAAEVERARRLAPESWRPRLHVSAGPNGEPADPGSAAAMEPFLAALGVSEQSSAPPREIEPADPDVRQRRLVGELEAWAQRLLDGAEAERNATFWEPLASAIESGDAAVWDAAVEPHRERFGDEVIGALPGEADDPNPRSRLLEETDRWTAWEVVLDVRDGIIAWGYLLLPHDIQPGERRPVVVCQHGLEGLPADVINRNPESRAWRSYKAFAARLADEGFITFAPHNPYRGGDAFRTLQRKLNPLGLTLFSVIVAQHETITEWLARQTFADPERIGFYGLSYGGKTAMRVPALVDRYCLSICSADFNEWIRKNAAVAEPHSYMFTGEYEIFEFGLGRTFNYAEMAALIAPRPFMVERGHHDGVGRDEWVAFEFAKVRRLYTALGIPDRAAIAFFDGPHTIDAAETFPFLRRHLEWTR